MYILVLRSAMTGHPRKKAAAENRKQICVSSFQHFVKVKVLYVIGAADRAQN